MSKANHPLPYAGPDSLPTTHRSRVPAWAVAVAIVLAVAGGGVLWVLDGAFNRFDVIIALENGTAATLKRVEFYFDGRTIAFDNVAPGTTVRRNVTLRGSGRMNYAVLAQLGRFPPGIVASHLDADCKGQRIGLRLRGDGTAEEFLP